MCRPADCNWKHTWKTTGKLIAMKRAVYDGTYLLEDLVEPYSIEPLLDFKNTYRRLFYEKVL